MANIELDGANKKIKVDSGDLTLDVPGDIILDADGADLVFADGGTNILKVSNSSSDVVLQPQVDAKDIIFKQYDGTTVATVEDNGTFNIPTDKLAINGTAVTSTAAELNILDGVTSTAAELNILDGVTSTAAELNILDGVTSTAAELNILDGVTSTAAELNIVDGNTSATSTTLADADRVVVNDAGTMKQVAMTDVKTYMGGGLHTLISATDLPSEGTSFTIDNCFSDTYDKYLIFGERFRTGTNQSIVKVKLRTGGGSGSNAGNNLGGTYQGLRAAGGSLVDLQDEVVNSGDAPIGPNIYNDTEFHFMFHVFYPTNTAVNTVIQGKTTFREGSSSYSAFVDFGYLSISTEDHTGFSITSSNGNFNSTACRLSVYGITDGA